MLFELKNFISLSRKPFFCCQLLNYSVKFEENLFDVSYQSGWVIFWSFYPYATALIAIFLPSQLRYD